MIHIFVLNPYAGRGNFAEELRNKLERIEGLKYFIFNTRNAGYETELVRKIRKVFDDEELRFYCCGGSGTFCNMLNGIDDFSRVELAFYPCGLTNDFLKVYGPDQQKFFDIENLIHGEVHLIDYIKSNHGLALNTLSVGLDSKILENVRDYHFLSLFGKNVPYMLGFFNAMFFAKPQEYEIYVDDSKYEGAMSQIIFGNGNSIGGIIRFSEDNRVGDGSASFMIGPDRKGLRVLPIIRNMRRNRFNKYYNNVILGNCQNIRIRRIDGVPFQIDLDGEMQPEQTEWIATIVHKGLKFVVPKGVKAND